MKKLPKHPNRVVAAIEEACSKVLDIARLEGTSLAVAMIDGKELSLGPDGEAWDTATLQRAATVLARSSDLLRHLAGDITQDEFNFRQQERNLIHD